METESVTSQFVSDKRNIDLNNNGDYHQNVEVKVLDIKKNRSLIAKKAFNIDDILFKEQPLVSCQFPWNKFYGYKACEYCMRPLETAEENVRRLAEDSSINLPYIKENCATKKNEHCVCKNCDIEYCSESCRSLAYNMYHESLCLGAEKDSNHPLNLLMDVWRQVHLPPETTTIEIILKLIATIKQSDYKDLIIQKINNFESDLFNQSLPHKLLNERFFMELEGLRELTVNLFNQYLHVKECEPMLTEQGFRRLFSLIGRNSQGIGTSPLSVWVENCDSMKLEKSAHKKLDKYIDDIYDKLDKTSESFLNSEGSGLYELQSMINHSCSPNAEIKFKDNDRTLTLVALKTIQPGEEIFISYLDSECELQRSRHSRQKLLKENYLFTCECERCKSESNQLDVTSDEDEDLDDDEEDDEISDEDMEN